MSRPGARRGRRAWPALRLVLYGVAGWLLVSNALLNTALLEPLVNRKPERFSLHWGRALMLWPGRVTLWDVAMQGQVRRIAWDIRAARVSGHIALWSLLGKELRFRHLDGQLPVISVQRVQRELAPAAPRANAWRLRFDRVQVHSPLRFALDETVLSGTADARASWSQQLRGGRFELLPSSLHLRDARLERGGRVLLDELALQAQAQIEPHPRREHRGLAMLGFLALDVELAGRGPGYRLDVNEQFELDHALQPGRGHLRGRIVLDHGRVGDASTLSLRVPVEVTTHAGHKAQGDAQLTLQAEADDIALNLSLPPIPALIQRAEARMRLTSRALPLPPWEGQWQRVAGEIDLDARFSSLALVAPLLDRLHGFRLDGRGDVQGHIVLAQGQLARGTEVVVEDGAFTLEAWSHRFAGSARADARFAPGADGAKRAVAKVTLKRFDLAPLAAPDAILGSGRDLVLDLEADGSLAQMPERVRAHLRFADADLPDLTRFNRYLPANGVRLLAGKGRIGADMAMQVAEGRNGGSFTLAATGATLRMGEMVLRGDLQVDARVEAEALTSREFHLPGTRVSIRRAAIVEPAGEPVENWWGVANVTDGRMSFEPPMELAAAADVQLRDVAPLLAIFAQHRQFPRWVRRLVDNGEADARGRIQRQDDCMVLDRIVANNARFEVQGRLRLCQGPPSGQLYARWGVLGMALELGRGERKFHLVGAKKWFESQPAFLQEK